MLMGLDEQATRIGARDTLHGHVGVTEIGGRGKGHDEHSLGLAEAPW
jgi:hypothetical protein